MSPHEQGGAQHPEHAGGDGLSDCSEALLRVYEYLDGEMTPDDCAKIQRHLDACARCLQQYHVDTTLKLLVKRSCGGEQAPESLRGAIMSRISMTVIRIEES